MQGFGGNGSSAHNQEKYVAFSSFSYNIITSIIPLFLNCISELVSLIRIDVLQNRNILQEFFILISFELSRVLHDEVESAAVKGPKF